jgi:hypothetical protein
MNRKHDAVLIKCCGYVMLSDEASPERVTLRSGFAAVAVALLALAMTPPGLDGRVGTYGPASVAFAAAAGLFALGACVLSPRAWQVPPGLGRVAVACVCLLLAAHAGIRILYPTKETTFWAEAFVALTSLFVAGGTGRVWQAPPFPEALPATLALALSGEAVFFTDLQSPHSTAAKTVIRLASCAGFGVTASLLMDRGGRLRIGLQLVLLLLAGAVLRCTAAVAAPDPNIDVYDALREGTDHLLRGDNPYTALYRWEGAPFYPPFPFLVALPFRAAGLDMRLANALCDLVAALALLGVAWQRGRPLAGAFLAAAYLNFPRVPYMMDQAWYEPMLAAALGTGLLLAERGRWPGYFLLGLGLTGKPYGVFLLPPLARGLWPKWKALLAGLILAGAVVLLPFFLWDPQAFLEKVFFYHLRNPIRYDGITLQAAAGNLFGVVVPPLLLTAAAVLLVAWVTWRTPADAAAPAAPMATALLVFCLFHSQAFFNYFYLCAYLLLLGLAEWLAPPSPEGFARRRRGG